MLELGDIVYTEGVATKIEDRKLTIGDIHSTLSKYSSIEWSQGLSEKEWVSNIDALINDDRLICRYRVNEIELIVTTEPNRSRTTVLLPEEIWWNSENKE